MPRYTVKHGGQSYHFDWNERRKPSEEEINQIVGKIIADKADQESSAKQKEIEELFSPKSHLNKAFKTLEPITEPVRKGFDWLTSSPEFIKQGRDNLQEIVRYKGDQSGGSGQQAMNAVERSRRDFAREAINFATPSRLDLATAGLGLGAKAGAKALPKVGRLAREFAEFGKGGGELGKEAGVFKFGGKLGSPKPRWKSVELNFVSDEDKAAYILAGKGKSAQHDAILQAAQAEGLDVSELLQRGQKIRETIKSTEGRAIDNVLTVPSHSAGSRIAGTNPRNLGTNPRAVREAETQLDQITDLIAAGEDVPSIAQKLNLKPATIETLKRKHKLGESDIEDAVNGVLSGKHNESFDSELLDPQASIRADSRVPQDSLPTELTSTLEHQVPSKSPIVDNDFTWSNPPEMGPSLIDEIGPVQSDQSSLYRMSGQELRENKIRATPPQKQAFDNEIKRRVDEEQNLFDQFGDSSDLTVDELQAKLNAEFTAAEARTEAGLREMGYSNGGNLPPNGGSNRPPGGGNLPPIDEPPTPKYGGGREPFEPKHLWDLLGPFQRSMQSMGEMSFPLRQGKIALTAHPSQIPATFKNMFKSFKDPAYADEILDEIGKRPFANIKEFADKGDEGFKEVTRNLYNEAKLGLSDPKDVFPSNLAHTIPGLAQISKRSEAAYGAGADSLRANLFDQVLKKHGFSTENLPSSDQIEQFGNYVNTVTGYGRGNDTFERAVKPLQSILYSPRYQKSNLDVINPVNYTGGNSRFGNMNPFGPPSGAKELAKDVGKFSGAVGSGLAAADYASDDVDVNWNPMNTDFGKLKIGDTRVDPLGPLGSYPRFFAGALNEVGKRKLGDSYKEQASKVFGEEEVNKRRDTDFLLGNLVRSKLAPGAMTYTADEFYGKGKNAVGEPINNLPFSFPGVGANKKFETPYLGYALGQTTPLYYQDMAEIEDGPTQAALAVPGFFGANANTYKKREKKVKDPSAFDPNKEFEKIYKSLYGK